MYNKQKPESKKPKFVPYLKILFIEIGADWQKCTELVFQKRMTRVFW